MSAATADVPASCACPGDEARRPRSRVAFSDCSWFVALVAVSRFACRSHFLYDIDSVNFALAMSKFDPVVHQPHPPGYFLFVLFGRLLNSLTGDANLALVLISIAASCGSIVMIYLLSADWFGRGAAVFSSLLFLFSPLAWFHGTVALTYVTECLFSAMIGYLGWRLTQGGNYAIALSAALGLAAGFRPSTILLLGPLYAYAIFRGRRSRIFLNLAVLLAVCLCWFVPMVWLTGGPERYLQSLTDLWSVAGGKNTVLTSSIAYSLVRLVMIAAIGGICFGTGVVFAFTNNGKRSPIDRARDRFVWVWIAPGLVFFTFVFLRFVNSGYLLFLSPPLFAYLGRNAAQWWNSEGISRRSRGFLLCAGAAANAAFFLFGPIYCSYRSVRQFEGQLVSFTTSVRRMASPDDTMLVGFDSHFLGYRHAAYYLPEYLTLQFPEVTLHGRLGVFAVKNRETRFLTNVPRDRFGKFILLPLVPDEEDRLYTAKVLSRFRQGTLRPETLEGWEFETGATAELVYLFAH